MRVEEKETTGMSKQPLHNYRDLLVWQKSMQMTEYVYTLTRKFPTDERFGMIAQMRRAAVSVPSNIAEGQARNSTREFIQFISHAEGSLAEVDTQLTLSITLGFCGAEETAQISAVVEEIRKMLMSLRSRLSGSAPRR